MCKHCHKSKKCQVKKNLPGIYIGSLIFASVPLIAPETKEALTYQFLPNGSWSLNSTLETYKNVSTPLVPLLIPFNDQESQTLGEWKVDLNGIITASGFSYRQAGPDGGIPRLGGLTNADIPSLPNYLILYTVKFTLDGDVLQQIPGSAKVYVTDVNWSIDNQTSLFPFA